jgi:hypothetical protein
VVLVALSRLVLVLAVLALAAPARADEPVEIVPPSPDGPITIPAPADAPPQTGLVNVSVRLTIGVDGTVTAVELAEGAGEPWDAAVLEGAKQFRFHPALVGGVPTAVIVPFTQTFAPPPPPPDAVTSEKTWSARLEGIVIERGTRKPLKDAVVVVKDADGERIVATDADGHFAIGVNEGESAIEVSSTGYRRFARREVLKASEQIKVKYLVERETYDRYEAVVIGSRDREEISRTTLSGREVHELPGTFGDPFRAVALLPGVTNVMSLLPLPVVRGSSPGNTGIFLDGVRLPLLFHLFGGPSVVHPEFIDRVDFYPGGFPVSYGGYTGGIIDGQTRRSRDGERLLDIDINLLQTGVFARREIPNTSMVATVAGRYGYPGLLLSALTPDVSLAYWDYQARVDGGSAGRQWSVFAYGAKDEVKTLDPSATNPDGTPVTALTTQALFMFHRLDARLRLGNDERNGSYRMVVGVDDSRGAGDQAATHSWMLNPQASWLLPLLGSLKLRTGTELLVRDIAPATTPTSTVGAGIISQATGIIQESGVGVTGGAFVELPWRPRENLLLVPGVRGDVYTHDRTVQWDVDPRLTLRFKLAEAHNVWLKAIVGRYHQPPRLFVPVPGLDQSSLKLGLLASTQYGAGLEAGLAPGIDLDVQGYYNDMNPVVFDLQVNQALSDVQQLGPTVLPGQVPPATQPSEVKDITRLFTKRQGRSYGLELLLRKRDTNNVFGWLAYTLSRSERRGDDGTYAPFDFDRTQIINAVAGVRLPRNWDLGARVLLQSGTPVTNIHGYNAARTDWQFRVDVRIDKRAVWNTWLLDFYVDVVNSSVAEESGGLVGNQVFRYVLPTVGFRAVL